VTAEERADLAYFGKLIADARGHLDGALSAMATATAWVAIMAGRQTDDDEEGGTDTSTS
jgi:hypothetical protein